MTEWPYYVGAEQAHPKYSTADDITVANVGNLEIVWRWEANQKPLEAYDTRPGPFQARLGTHGKSGPIVTKGGLVFLGGSAPCLCAFDKATGAEVWRAATPYRTNANPMTYRARSGRQFVVIATGAGSVAALGTFARAE